MVTYSHTYVPTNDSLSYTKGSVYWATLAPQNNNNSILNKKRPVVIVSSLAGSLNNSLVTVCPFTTQLKDLEVNVDVSFSLCDKKSQVCCNQITTIPKTWLSNYAGELSVEDLDKVHQGILVALGLQHLIYQNVAAARDVIHMQEQNKVKLDELTRKAQDLIQQLSVAIARANPSAAPAEHPTVNSLVAAATGKTYTRRSPQEIADFITKWQDESIDKEAVAEAFNFSSVHAARTFYNRHKDDVQ